MLDISQLRTYVIRPTLQFMGMWTQVGEDLVTGTAIQESKATYLHQLGAGPALGIFQMEVATHDDCWTNFINFRSDIKDKLVQLVMNGGNCPMFQIPAQEMTGNLFYAAAMCRIRYKRAPAGFPQPGDIQGLADYWKQWYNTPQGAGTADEFLNNYNQFNQN